MNAKRGKQGRGEAQQNEESPAERGVIHRETFQMEKRGADRAKEMAGWWDNSKPEVRRAVSAT
jgi:hypothetical protein